MEILHKYEQFAQVLTDRIRSCRYPPDSLLPSERELTYEFGISRVTVRLGLERLKQQHLIVPLPGKGCCVLGKTRPPSRGRSYLIAGLFAGIRNMMTTGPMADAVCSVLEPDGYHLVYSSSNDRLQSEITRIRALLAKGVDGLILQPTFKKLPDQRQRDDNGNHAHLHQIHTSGRPVVVVDRAYGANGIPCVCNDERAGGCLAAEYLFRRGYRRVIYLAANFDRIGRLRHQGYRDAVKKHGGRPSAPLLADLSISSIVNLDEAAVEAVRRLLGSLREETGVVTMGRFPWLLEQMTLAPDYRGPRLEWTGYDYSPTDLGCQRIPFAYVQRPMGEIGRRAAEKMLALLDGRREAATEDLIKPTMIELDGQPASLSPVAMPVAAQNRRQNAPSLPL